MSLVSPFRTLIAAGLCLVLAACGASTANPRADAAQRVLKDAGVLNQAGLVRLERGMALGSLALAARFDPGPHADFWGRPTAWTSLDLDKPPTLPWGQLSPADAALLNAMLPIGDTDFSPAQPFYLHATGAERERAILCMTQAVYYEAALEPLAGQQAVAQTIINRVRHPDFPKSICGVVYQNSETPITCQFTFTCDGSLARTPMEPYWSRAKEVAEAALDGFVAKQAGPATAYHADYVFPRWREQMVKIVQLGATIFYRYPGPLGAPQLLTSHYAGNELAVSMTGPSLDAIAAAKAAMASSNLSLADLAGAPIAQPNEVWPTGGRPAAVLPPMAQPATVAAAPPLTPVTAQSVARLASAAAPMQQPAPGQVVAGRRIPTRQEIARVNAQLPPADDDGPIATAHDAR